MKYTTEDLIMLVLTCALLVFLVWLHVTKAEAAEGFVSIVIRCQQSDICHKREIPYPTEAACDAANEQVVAAIGETDDIVIAYCVGGEE